MTEEITVHPLFDSLDELREVQAALAKPLENDQFVVSIDANRMMANARWLPLRIVRREARAPEADMFPDAHASEIRAPEPPADQEDAQPSLFDPMEAPAPSVEQEVYKVVYVHFESRDDVEAFARAIGQPVTTETREICFPAGLIANGKRYL